MVSIPHIIKRWMDGLRELNKIPEDKQAIYSKKRDEWKKTQETKKV